MRRVLGIALSCALAAATAGCDQLPDREFAALEGALTLRIVQLRSLGAEQTRFDLELTNGSATRAHACLGPDRHVTGLSGSARFTWVSHPGCTREFALEPGRVLAWSETHDVALRPELPDEVSVEVQILNPRRCSSVGCAGFTIESRPLTTSR